MPKLGAKRHIFVVLSKTVAIILNWNEYGVASKSFTRLINEGIKTVVVDNGSTAKADVRWISQLDPTKEHTGYRIVANEQNLGSSLGRNRGIMAADQWMRDLEEQLDWVFLLDGDILYVPGSVEAYLRIISRPAFSSYACIGRHDQQQFMKDGHNGTLDLYEADQRIPEQLAVHEGFPMAWTQYGLFRTSAWRIHGRLCQGKLFPSEGPFGAPGHGYEDDWMFNLLLEGGWKVMHTTAPLYYHQASSGPRELAKAGIDSNEGLRKTLFEARFGPKAGWRTRLSDSGGKISYVGTFSTRSTADA